MPRFSCRYEISWEADSVSMWPAEKSRMKPFRYRRGCIEKLHRLYANQYPGWRLPAEPRLNSKYGIVT